MNRFNRLFVILLLAFSFILIYGKAYAEGFTYHYDTNGRLSKIKSDDTIVKLEYDSNGNLVKKKKYQLGFGLIESPIEGQEITTNTLEVKGWFIDESGVESIKVYINDTYKGLATYGDSREDVYMKYPNYNNHNSGFNFKLLLPFKNDLFKLKLVIQNKNGDEVTLSRHFMQKMLPPIGQIEIPSKNAKISYYPKSPSLNSMTIKGFHLKQINMKNIEIYIDNTLITPINSTLNMSRTDIYGNYPEYNNISSGYNLIISIPWVIKTTSKELKIIVEDVNGDKTIYIQQFIITYMNVGINPPPIISE